MMELERVEEFVKTNYIEFDDITFECEWNGFNVYTLIFDSDEEDNFVGLPKYILVDEHKNIRLAKDDEVYEILESLPDE
jgi:hypothetical protein